MDDAYGVYPDGLDRAAAVFQELEDAIAWGLARFGEDHFAIRYCPVRVAARMVVEPGLAAS
jgi:hypothetical protein